MRKRLALAVLLALGTVGGPALAQDNGAADSGDSVTVKFGGFKYDLFPDEPVQACIISREDGQSGGELEYRLFVREDDGSFSSVGVYPTDAIGALTFARYGDCVSLEVISDAD